MIYVNINIQNKEHFINQIQYTFKTIFCILGIEFEFIDLESSRISTDDIVINYGQKIQRKNNFINIKCGELFTGKYLRKESIPNQPLKKYNDIPIIYLSEDVEPYVVFKKKYIVTNIDIIQSIFFTITCYEEALLFENIKKDKCERFPSKKTLAFKENFVEIPIANEYIEWLLKWIRYLKPEYNKKLLFKDYQFTACLSHDVDRIEKYTYPLVNDIKKLKNCGLNHIREIFLHTLKNIDHKYDPFNTFEYLRKCEKKYGFSSSFYFMTGGETSYDNNYRIDDVYDLIKKLEKDDCEIGYHYSFNAYKNLKLRMQEKTILDEKVKNHVYGGRNHYLRFRAPISWKISQQVNLLYDTTVGYNDMIGFRCGLCTPYKVFDIFDNSELDIWEIPLIIMDGALKFGQTTIGKENDVKNQIKKYIDIVREYNGTFSVLWHNSSFDQPIWNGSKKIYEWMLNYLYNNGAIGLTGRKLIKEIIRSRKHGKNINNKIL